MQPLKPAISAKKSNEILAIAPSGAFKSDAVSKAQQQIRQIGLNLVLDESVKRGIRTGDISPFDFLAAPDSVRRSAVEQIFTSKYRAVWNFRGGYGAGRALPKLMPKQRATLFLGFSDATAIHNFINRTTCSVHAPNLNRFWEQPDEVKQAIVQIVNGQGVKQPLTLGNRLKTVRKGVATGVIAGGNLTVLASLCGTQNAPQFGGKILLLEDIAELPYRIDRALFQLYSAGAFEGVCGVLLGEFIPPEGIEQSELEEFVAKRVCELIPNVPVLAGAEVGHGKRNFPVPLGVAAELDATHKQVVVLSEWVEWI